MSAQPVEILIKNIKTDPVYYPRFQPDSERIKEFVEAMEYGEYFPPIKVAKDEKKGFYVLLDGKHRLEAKKILGEEKIAVDIFSIQKSHWLMAAARFNDKSSKPLTSDEIKQIIIDSWRSGIRDTNEIAEEMGRSVRYVEMVLKPIRAEERHKREAKVLKLSEKGMSQRQIASEVGLSLGSVNKALNSHHNDPCEDPIDKPPEPGEVFTKRSDFVSRTPGGCNNTNVLENHPTIFAAEMDSPSASNPDQREEVSKAKRIGFVPTTPEEKSKVVAKHDDFCLKAPPNQIIEKQDHSGASESEANNISSMKQSSPHTEKPNRPDESDPSGPSEKYPSYLGQIKFYHELPQKGQQAIRAMELARKYKLDIIDMVEEIDESVLWLRKVMVAAFGLSLMRGSTLDDASSVETLIGIELEVVRCIQKALPFKAMLCPVSPDMDEWINDNLSANDLEMIAALAGVNKDDIPYLIKGESPPQKTHYFTELPVSYKEHLQTNTAVLRELRNHAQNKRFNSDSARQLLTHLNKNVTVINEIFDVLHSGELV